MRPKIAFVSRYPWSMQYGGAELQAQNYIEGLRGLGYEANFLNYYDKDINADIVHCVGLNWETETLVRSIKRQGKIAVVSPVFYVDKVTEVTWAVASRLTKYKFNALLRLKNSLSEADVVLPNSMEESRQISAIFGATKSKKVILRNGVDTEYFIDYRRNSASKKECIVLCVSMIDERKNTLGLIRAFLRSGVAGKLVIVGSVRSMDTAYIQEINRLVAENDNVILAGFLSKDEIRDYYLRASAHVLPSKLETPGLSTLEALSCGIPCVVGDCPPVREYFHDSVLYADYRDENSISEAIKRALSDDWDPNQLRSVAVKYSWKSVAEDLAAVYEDVVEESRNCRQGGLQICGVK